MWFLDHREGSYKKIIRVGAGVHGTSLSLPVPTYEFIQTTSGYSEPFCDGLVSLPRYATRVCIFPRPQGVLVFVLFLPGGRGYAVIISTCRAFI